VREECAVPYDRECNHSICEKVVIQAWQICSSSHEKLDGGVNLYRQSIVAFDHIEVLFLLLLQVANLTIEMLDDFRGAIDRDEGCDVVEGRVGGQES
jgi:hypothetical protein